MAKLRDAGFVGVCVALELEDALFDGAAEAGTNLEGFVASRMSEHGANPAAVRLKDWILWPKVSACLVDGDG